MIQSDIVSGLHLWQKFAGNNNTHAHLEIALSEPQFYIVFSTIFHSSGKNWKTPINCIALWKLSSNMWRWGIDTYNVVYIWHTHTQTVFLKDCFMCFRVTRMPGLLWSLWKKQKRLGTTKSYASPWVRVLTSTVVLKGRRWVTVCVLLIVCTSHCIVVHCFAVRQQIISN